MSYVNVAGVLVSEEIFQTYFSCDYEKCHGACCWASVDGIELQGAILTFPEGGEITDKLPELVEYCEESKKKKTFRRPMVLTRKTLCANLTKEGHCVFVNMDKKSCSLKLAHDEGKLSFGVPISCGLYPIVEEIEDGKVCLILENIFDEYCRPAFEKGAKEKISVIQFCEEPLKRRFGDSFYEELLKIQTTYLT